MRKTDDNPYFRELDQCVPMTREEEREAGRELVVQRRRAKAGEKGAKAALRKIEHSFIQANLRLVVKMAGRYGQSVARVDLIQEGNIGLMRAVQKFDPEKGFRFCTYAAWWVRQCMTRYLHRTGRAVAVPSHTAQRASTLRRVSKQLHARLGREPTEGELAEETDLSPAKVRLAMRAMKMSLSLDTPMDEEGQPLSERLVHEGASASDRLAEKERRDEVHAALQELPERDADILRRRFAFGRHDPATLAEVGEEYDLSRERIRQLQERALTRLRRPLRHHGAADPG